MDRMPLTEQERAKLRHHGWGLVAVSSVILLISLVGSLTFYLLGGGGMPAVSIVVDAALFVTIVIAIRLLIKG